MNNKIVASAPSSNTVIASFVFLDLLDQPIEGLTVKALSPSINQTGTTDHLGHAFTIENAPRNEAISIAVKKKSGSFEVKGKVTPRRDVNAYTIKSPELHIEATTKLTSKEELEQDLVIPTMNDGEVMTIARLLEEFAPYIGAAIKITEVGKLVKFINGNKTIDNINTPSSNATTNATTRQYKVIKTEKPNTISLNLLASKLNNPTRGVSDETYNTIAKELKCEPAAIKAVATTESSDGGFMSNGLPKILFERHKFYNFTNPNKINNNSKQKIVKPIPHPFDKFPDICHPEPGGYGSTDAQYSRFIKAARLDKEAAIKACSWGAFQVLAEYHEQCGYGSPEQLADDCMKSEEAHTKLFHAFLKMPDKKKAIEGLRNKDWEQFTTYYNGSNWPNKNANYPKRMADNYEIFKK